jgi:hypothetical protein
MRNTKTLLAAASLAVLTAAGAAAANAAPWDHHDRPVIRQETRDLRFDTHRRIVDRDRVLATLRLHHYRLLGEPAFVRGHYVVQVAGRFGHPLFVEIDPYTGAFIGDFRI